MVFYYRIDMYFEGSRDVYMGFLPMLFRGTEEEITKNEEPKIDKYLPIYEKVRFIVTGKLP